MYDSPYITADINQKINILENKIAGLKLTEAYHGLCSEAKRDLCDMQMKLNELKNRLYNNQKEKDNQWRNW